ncbi:M20 family metallopeptidase [Lyngbya confervoides]|uniref:M20 family metallopeptidase n=1 Tax=Lyngbya confervoides BDU141951 TaxID=1574623 RepID=A0ABD4T502_9CYAN|nr:M20 family metallopeptidase [Lyngbya confervoides]MCM1983645.1 M20 family metallopeptidase [Lyngbya confervoides BDU141951]
MTELLQQLVSAESPSTVPAAQQPVLHILQRALQTRNYRAQIVPGHRTGGHLLARPNTRCPGDEFQGSRGKQLILGHCDTVWPLGTLETMPFTLRQGKAFGPGTYDMKAGLVMALYALEALQALSQRAPLDPMIFINSDEEIGSIESTPHIQQLAKQVERAYVLEPSLGPQGKIKTARKGVGRFSVKVLGRAAHAGLDPDKGVSAILELAIVIQRLFQLNDPDRGITVNVGTIDGGIRSNVVAPESRAEVDVRVLHAEDAQRLATQILGLRASTPGTTLEITGTMGRPPMEHTPRNEALWQQARSVAADLGLDLEAATAGGGSDGNTTSLHTATLDGLGAVGDGAHAPGEYIHLDSLIERSALLTRLLLLPSCDAPSDAPPDPCRDAGDAHD